MAKTYTEIKAEIASDITGKTEKKSITKTAVGGAIGDVLDYASCCADAIRLTLPSHNLFDSSQESIKLINNTATNKFVAYTNAQVYAVQVDGGEQMCIDNIPSGANRCTVIESALEPASGVEVISYKDYKVNGKVPSKVVHTTQSSTKYLSILLYIGASFIDVSAMRVVYGDHVESVSNSQSINTIKKRIALKPYTHTPVVIFRTDDGNMESDKVMIDLLDKYGIKSMIGIIGQTLASSTDEYRNYYKSLQDNGHSILNHGNSAALFTSLTDDELIANITDAKNTLESNGLYASGIIYPGGMTNDNIDGTLKKLFNYSVKGGSSNIVSSSNVFMVETMNFESSNYTIDALKGKVDELLAFRTYAILCFAGHSVNIGKEGYRSLNELTELCEYIKTKIDDLSLRSVTPDDAIAELRDL